MDEIAAIEAIYSDDVDVCPDSATLSFFAPHRNHPHRLHVRFFLPPEYPLLGPPCIEVEAKHLDAAALGHVERVSVETTRPVVLAMLRVSCLCNLDTP